MVIFASSFVLMMCFGVSQSAWASDGAGKQGGKAGPPSIKLTNYYRSKTYIKRRWGVEVMHVRQSAAGYMLEFRYKVLDPEKAKLLMNRKIKPLLTHVESGVKMIVPSPETTGPMRNSYHQLAGKVYWMLFANPAKFVKPGDHVNIEIGEFIVNGLVVQ